MSAWISLAQQLPPDGTSVLASIKLNGERGHAVLWRAEMEDGEWWWEWADIPMDIGSIEIPLRGEVTHWMPLPPPPA